MKHLFVPYPIALSLKKKGFDESCICFYKEDNEYLKSVDQHWGSSLRGICEKDGYKIDDLILAPTYEQVIDWFESKDIYIYAFRYAGKWQWKIDVNNSTDSWAEIVGGRYEALNAAITYALTLI